MRCFLSLATVLTSALIILSIQLECVISTPIFRRATQEGVTVPLKRVEIAGSRNIHGQIYLQQHMNRALRRFARMTGGEEPSKRELHARLEKRILTVEGPRGLEKRYNRYGVPNYTTADNVTSGSAPAQFDRIGEAVAFANPPTEEDTLGLDIEAQDLGYIATVQIGTPPRDFRILMDSGSADFWVGAENCETQDGHDCPANKVVLGELSSTSFVDTLTPFSVMYGTGFVTGDIITDNVFIAGLALSQHTFGVATNESFNFAADSIPFDGLMGFAKSTLTPVEALAQAGLIPAPITSFKISRVADNLNDGEVTFGSFDTSKFDVSTLTALPNVNPDGFWELDLSGVSVNGNDLGLQGRTAVFDTGTVLMLIPAVDAATIHGSIQGAQFDGQGGFTIPCTSTASVALTFGSESFTIDSRDIAFQPVDPAKPLGDCVSGITSNENIAGANRNQWLVGNVFLKNVYLSTDVSRNTVTLAKHD